MKIDHKKGIELNDIIKNASNLIASQIEEGMLLNNNKTYQKKEKIYLNCSKNYNQSKESKATTHDGNNYRYGNDSQGNYQQSSIIVP